MRTFASVAELQAFRRWFWPSFTITFLVMGLLLPALLAFLGMAWAFGGGGGVGPLWLLLAYPAVIGLAWLATRTNPERPGPHGTLWGASWGLGVFVLAVVVLLATAPKRPSSGQGAKEHRQSQSSESVPGK